MNYKSGFTFVELIIALAICSMIFGFLIPNLVRQYSTIAMIEKQLEMKEILYEEISNHYNEKNFSVRRENYEIVVSLEKAEIVDINTNEKVSYE
ncbi:MULTISPECIES: competence type IV pilus minor pilin ComGE [Gemella]|uniref:competence type IV pilus minor pilin ComGE n=1 Tax=Gemella TaxID=1378 RepID=UPI000768272D|nr:MULTISPECIES: competence type IV pilus minor pilin ComGE [Gemella]AME09643.1 general secretion pathway protein [Gemella sp. oral taxon 928]AXI27244.1 type II secretion system protein [Gemella sp. ND 6198]